MRPRFVPIPSIGRAFAISHATILCMTIGGLAQEDEEAERTHDYLELQHTLSTDFATPHTPWAKPFAGGKLKAVFFANWSENSTDAREIIELMQRLDLDASAVYVLDGTRLLGNGRPDWYGGDPEAGAKRVLRLLSQPVDAIFLNQVTLNALATNVQDLLHQKVTSGSGLLWLGGPDSVPFQDAHPRWIGDLADAQPDVR